MKTQSRRLTIASFCLAVAAASGAHAQSDYPNKPVRIVVDSAAGSANDATSRIIADKLGRMWNQQVVTLNQPGAGGGISAKVASQSPNDGYTLYLPATSPFLALPGAPGVAPNLPIELPRLRRHLTRPGATVVHRRVAQVRHQHHRRRNQDGQGKARRGDVCRDRTRPAHASDDGTAASPHRH